MTRPGHSPDDRLHASGLEVIEGAEGNRPGWRLEVREDPIRQRLDGSWSNEDDHRLEGEPTLVTGYALLALAYWRPAVEKYSPTLPIHCRPLTLRITEETKTSPPSAAQITNVVGSGMT